MFVRSAINSAIFPWVHVNAINHWDCHYSADMRIQSSNI
jgi:hypothetical protein